MNFRDALWELILGRSGTIPTAYDGSWLLVFATATAAMGLIAVILDRVVFSVRGHSVFGFAYGSGFKTGARLILLWGVGAGLGAFLGCAASIVQVTRAACISVGVGWPLILPRLIDSLAKKEDRQVPEAK